MVLKKEILTKSWKDWIDYWAVDFDFENKKEIFKENLKMENFKKNGLVIIFLKMNGNHLEQMKKI